MKPALIVLLAIALAACGVAKTPAVSVCSPGDVAASQPVSLVVDFGFSGCAATDATCAVSVDGGVISMTTSATVCSAGCQPVAFRSWGTCRVPPLTPGEYQVVPFNKTLTVRADGGSTGC